MGRPQDVAKMVLEGRSPNDVADALGVTLASVEGYLHRAIGEGLLRRSDVYFAVPPERRSVDRTASKWLDGFEHLLADMYDDIRRTEMGLHGGIRATLFEEHGPDETGWWRNGIPEAIRVKCQERRERDADDPCEPFCYADLLDLSAILVNQWSLFRPQLPAYASNRQALVGDLHRLNRVRNKVMHPLRGFVPEERDFDFVRDLRRALVPLVVEQAGRG